MTDPAVMQFHLLALKTAIPGFKGYDAFSILWGIILIFVYGFVASVIYHSLHLDCCDRSMK